MKNKKISILRLDKEYDYAFSNYNHKLLSSYGYDVRFIDDISDINMGELNIVCYLILKNKDFVDSINTEYDFFGMYESPVIDVVSCTQSNKTKCFNCYMFSVNNKDVKEHMLYMQSPDFYKWIKSSDYTTSTAFSNILVKEKMIMCSVTYVPEESRNYFIKLIKDNKI